jgi:hypothetical protein
MASKKEASGIKIQKEKKLFNNLEKKNNYFLLRLYYSNLN